MTSPVTHAGGERDLDVTSRRQITAECRELVERLGGAGSAQLEEMLRLLKQANGILGPLTEERLRGEGRLHGPEAYSMLGLEVRGEIPAISEDLVALCDAQPVKSMIVLDAGYSLLNLPTAPRGKAGWGMWIEGAARERDFASVTHDTPAWVIVPMDISRKPKTIGLSKRDAIRAVQSDVNGQDLKIIAPDARLMALGLLLHGMSARKMPLPGNVYTFTNESDVFIGGTRREGFSVEVHGEHIDAEGGWNTGLAPVAIKGSPAPSVGYEEFI